MGKICSTCNIDRPLSDFWKRPDSVDGVRGRCIECSKAGHVKWMSSNRDKKRTSDRAYHAVNKAASNKRSRDYYRKNKDRCGRRTRAYAAANLDKIKTMNRKKREMRGDDLRARRRQHYQENSSRYKAQAIARRAYIKQATPSWADLEKIALIYAEAERITRATGIQHHVDHLYPLRGKTMCGLHVEGNLRIMVGIDNLKKSNSVTPEECPWVSDQTEGRGAVSSPTGQAAFP